MSTRCVTSPVWAVTCDGGCGAEVQRQGWENEWGMRAIAARAGWSTRPPYGKGSRSVPDLCPNCAAEAATR